jgi:hypothetical protein
MFIIRARYALGLAVLVGQLAAARGLPRHAAGTIDGLVTDFLLAPIEGAVVGVASTNLQVRTGASGRFRITKLPAGQYALFVRKLGFEQLVSTLDIGENDTTRVTYFLQPAAISLDTSRIVASSASSRLSEFLERRQHSVGGKFIIRADIEKQAPTQTTDLLRRVTGLTVADSEGTLIAISARGLKMAIVAGHLVPVQCTMQVMVDGHRMPPGFAMNSMPPNDILGIEIYAGPASIPPLFNGAQRDMFCGLIVIWTRSGSDGG